MPAAVVGALITGGAVAGSTIYGAKKASNSNDRATEAQLRANREALAFERDRYEQERDRYDQWRAGLNTARPERRAPSSVGDVFGAGALVGQRPPMTLGQARQPSNRSMSGGSMPGGGPPPMRLGDALGSSRGGGQGGVRMLIAGAAREVPAAFVDTWKARGAQVVN